jgi:hypothetical protein
MRSLHQEREEREQQSATLGLSRIAASEAMENSGADPRRVALPDFGKNKAKYEERRAKSEKGSEIFVLRPSLFVL